MASVWYNEIDPFAAQWLRQLIEAGHIAPGVVDERSILDVRPGDLRSYAQCHFFAGIGVWSYALRQARWPDDRPVWTGSCPCQPLSSAGQQRGHADIRHLWPAFHALIAECAPPVLFGEQVASKDGREWFSAVRADLERSGYACGAADLAAAGVGAPHIRQRLFFVGLADADGGHSGTERQQRGGQQRFEPQDGGAGDGAWPGAADHPWSDADWLYCRDGKWRPVEPGTFPLASGAAARVGRLRGYGNALCAPAATAFIEAVMDLA